LTVNPYVSFQVLFPPELKAKLFRRALETGVTQREIVTDALRRYLAEEDSRAAVGAGTTSGPVGSSPEK